MDADKLGLDLIQDHITEQEARWMELAQALGGPVESKLPDKEAYQAARTATIFNPIFTVNNAFVPKLDAWVKWAMAWQGRFKTFVANKDSASEEVREGVSQASREILGRWQILTAKGWVSGYSAADDAAEAARQYLRDNAGNIGLGIGGVVLGLIVLAVVLAFRR